MPSRLEENVLIDAIDQISSTYSERFGRAPFNVSHWDPSEEFIRNLRAAAPIARSEDLVPYRYSYMIEERPAVLAKLGLVSRTAVGLFTENGSMSILAVANFLSASSVSHVYVAAPCYFITTHSLEKFGLQTSVVSHSDIRRTTSWPANLKLHANDALWITNPTYNTGSYAIEEQCEAFLRLANSGTKIILDEALAITPTKLGARLVGHPNVLAIYTPQKSICLNRLKFSIVAFHLDHEDFFDDWADVLFGGLSASATAAVTYFLSSDFDSYQSTFLTHVDLARDWHHQLLRKYDNKIITDPDTRGHFISVYVPSIDFQLGCSLAFLSDVIVGTGAAFIPGNRSYFDPSLGLSFRINLARDSAQFRGAVSRLYSHFLGGQPLSSATST